MTAIRGSNEKVSHHAITAGMTRRPTASYNRRKSIVLWTSSRRAYHRKHRRLEMKTVALAITFVLGIGSFVFAAEVTGKLVDQMCYAKEKDSKMQESAAEEAACAQACAKKGAPVA